MKKNKTISTISTLSLVLFGGIVVTGCGLDNSLKKSISDEKMKNKKVIQKVKDSSNEKLFKELLKKYKETYNYLDLDKYFSQAKEKEKLLTRFNIRLDDYIKNDNYNDNYQIKKIIILSQVNRKQALALIKKPLTELKKIDAIISNVSERKQALNKEIDNKIDDVKYMIKKIDRTIENKYCVKKQQDMKNIKKLYIDSEKTLISLKNKVNEENNSTKIIVAFNEVKQLFDAIETSSLKDNNKMYDIVNSYSETLLDMRARDNINIYEHKILYEINGKTTTNWVIVSKEKYNQNISNLGMTLMSKPYDTYRSEAIKQAIPQGLDKVGNKEYGSYNSSGIWVFFMPSFNNNSYSQSDRDYYDRERRGSSPYYGHNNSYGTYGSKTKSKYAGTVKKYGRTSKTSKSGFFSSSRSSSSSRSIFTRGG